VVVRRSPRGVWISLGTSVVATLVMGGCGQPTVLSALPATSTQLMAPFSGVGSGGERPVIHVIDLSGPYVMAETCVGSGSVVVTLQPQGIRFVTPCAAAPNSPNHSEIATGEQPGPQTPQTATVAVSADQGTQWRVAIYAGSAGPDFGY
jgi:hypothetical protein